MFSLHNSMALAKAIAQAIARSECQRASVDARLATGSGRAYARGANRLRLAKHLIGLTEITKKVFVPEYIGYKS
jgi:hypothetical protein